MADRLSILLSVLLDKAAQKDTERGLESIIGELDKLNEAELDELAGKMYIVGQAAEAIEQRFADSRSEVEKFSRSTEGLARISTTLLALGTGIVGGISLSARQYVKFIEQAQIKGDETADKWIAATKRIQNASLNLGETAAQAILPTYEKAAQLAEKAAAFVDKNPELVRAALNTGLVVATLGAVGTAVTRGIKLYTDIKYLAATAEYSLATRRFENSVRAFLTGTVLPKSGTGLPGGGAAGKAASALGTVSLFASAVVIGTQAGAAIGNALGRFVYGPDYKKQGLGDAALTATRVAQLPALSTARNLQAFGDVIPALGQIGQKLEENVFKADAFVKSLLGLEQSTDEAKTSADELAGGLRDFQQEATLAQATQAYIQYRQQEAQAEEQYMSQRAQIVSQGAQQLAQIESNYMRQREQLAEQFAQSTALAIANFQYQQEQAAEDFARQEARAYEDYQESRLEAQQDFQEEEQDSRRDHLKEMQRLQLDHDDRIAELAAKRDALGIVRENRAFARAQKELEEDYSEERRQRKQQLRKRLEDLDEQFQQERQRAREDFEYRQQQAQEQFERQQELARQQFEQRLEQLEEEHQRQMELARRQTAERLRELEVRFRQEQIIRRNAFYDILRDLDANLLNEENLRNQYYKRMQDDLIRFLETTANSVRGTPGSNLPGYQRGGYTLGGPIMSHPDEFVLNKQTTKQLEGLIGGRLTQDGVVGALSESSTINVGPFSFDGRITAADRDQIQKMVEQTALVSINRALKNR